MARARYLEDAQDEANIFLGLSVYQGKGKGYSSKSKSRTKGKGRTERSKSRLGSKGKGRSTSYSTADPPLPPPLPVSTIYPTFSSTVLQTSTVAPTQTVTLNIAKRSSNFCKTNSKGIFGSTQRGDSSLVAFLYRVELEPGTTKAQFETSILPAMEFAMVDLMIPSMFDGLCGSFRRLMTIGAGKGAYLGIDANPSDYVVVGASCGASYVQPCLVVSGYISAYSKGKSPTEVQAEMAALLKKAFSFGNLQNLVPGVDGVSLQSILPASATQSPTPLAILSLDLRTPLTPLQTNAAPANVPLMPTTKVSTETQAPSLVSAMHGETTQTKSPSEESKDGLPWWRWFISALIMLAMFVAIYVVWTRCYRPQHQSIPQDEQESFQDNDRDGF